MLHDYSSTIGEGRFPALSPNDGGGSHRDVAHHTHAFTSTNDGSNLTEPPLSASATCDIPVNARGLWDISAIIRAQTARDFSATIAEWQRASGEDRAYWRKYVKLYIREERAHQAKCAAALRAAAIRQRRRDAA